MRRAASLLAAAALLLLPAAPAAGQQAGLRIEEFDADDYPQVRLTVSMPAELVGADVAPQEFTVFEDRSAVDATVEPIPTEELNVVLVVDTSGSMAGEPLAKAQQAAAAFVDAMPPAVEVALVAFGREAEVVSPLSTDRARLQEAIAGLASRGETALYDGLVTATEAFGGGEGARRVVVMLSDGGDTVSAGTLEDAIVALLDAEATFYAVELQSAENDPEPLERLGNAADGRVVSAGDPEALDAIFAEIAASIVSQYSIEFEARGRGATRLEVQVATAAGSASLVRVVRFPQPPPLPRPEAPPPPPPATVSEPVAVPVTIPDYPPLPIEVVEPGPFSSESVLVGGLVAVFLALAALALYAARGGAKVRLVAADARKLAKTRRSSMLTAVTDRVADAAEHTLERRGHRGRLESALETAGLRLRSGEFVVLVAGAGLSAYVFGSLVAGPLAGLVAAAAVALLAWGWVHYRADRRQAAFAAQLSGTLQLLAGSLRAGFGLLQAIVVVSEEARSPTADEFHRVKLEVQLGKDLDEALEAMAQRVGGEDMLWVVEGIQIHREVGGDLSEIIDGVAETIRERDRLRRQVKALSAEGRFSAVVLVVLPVGMAGFLSVANPGYLGELTASQGGRTAIAIGAGLLVGGIFWMRRLVRLDF